MHDPSEQLIAELRAALHLVAVRAEQLRASDPHASVELKMARDHLDRAIDALIEGYVWSDTMAPEPER